MLRRERVKVNAQANTRSIARIYAHMPPAAAKRARALANAAAKPEDALGTAEPLFLFVPGGRPDYFGQVSPGLLQLQQGLQIRGDCNEAPRNRPYGNRKPRLACPGRPAAQWQLDLGPVSESALITSMFAGVTCRVIWPR